MRVFVGLALVGCIAAFAIGNFAYGAIEGAKLLALFLVAVIVGGTIAVIFQRTT